jgi:hypothetical protein
MNRDVELGQQLLEAKGDVKVQGKDGGVVLHIALLEAKADVKVQDEGLALCIGVNREVELAKQLLEAKRDVKV